MGCNFFFKRMYKIIGIPCPVNDLRNSGQNHENGTVKAYFKQI